LSERHSVGAYDLELNDHELVVRDHDGTIVETVKIDNFDGILSLPNGQRVDLASMLLDKEPGVADFETAAGPGQGGNVDGAGHAPASFRAFAGEDAPVPLNKGAGILGDTSLTYGQLETGPAPLYDTQRDDTARRGAAPDDGTETPPIPITWARHDAWGIPENQSGGTFGNLVDGDYRDFSYQVSDGRFEVVDGVLRLKDGESFDFETEPFVDLVVTVTSRTGETESQPVRIDVRDVNEAQTDIDLSGATILENVAGAVIGTVTIADPDKGDSQTITVSDPRFEVVDGQLKLKDGIALDFESESSIDVIVTATDKGGHTISEQFTLGVTDVNEAQTSLTLDGSQIAENVPGAVVGAINVADPDAGDSQSFAVSDPRFEVVDGQLKLKDGVSVDFESEPSINVVVTATDKAGHTVFEQFTLGVTDANEAQTALTLGGSQVAENAAGAAIGAVNVADPDAGDSQSFTVSDPRFEVIDGQLKLKDGISLDFESEPSIDLTITATDTGGHTISEHFTLSVTDVNEAQTSLALDGAHVVENAQGAVIGHLTVADPDAGDSQSFAVSDSRFEVVNGDLKLKDGVSLDFESEPGVNVTVTATDKGGHQIQQDFAITVGNENEAPTALTLKTDGAQLLVNGSFEANQLNNGQWKLFSGIDGWSTNTQIEVQNNVTNKASDGKQVVELDSDYQVDGLYQDVKTQAGHVYALSFDTATRSDTKHTDSIEVYWNGVKIGTVDPSSTTWQTSTFNVIGTGGNDRLEFREPAGGNDSYGGLLDNVSLKGMGSNVPENMAGVVIGTLTVVDPDAGDTHSFQVSDSRFEVVGNELKLKSGVSFNYEAEHSVAVTVTATDAGGKSIQQSFTIGVTDVNEAQTALAWTGKTVAENTSGTVVGTLSVVDPDAGDVQTFKVSDSRFEVVGNELKLKSGQSLNFEAEPTLNVTVTATDKAGHQISQTVTVNVTDVNEAQTGMTLSASKVAENAAGAVIGTLSVNDPDAGDAQSFKVSDNRFEVVGNQLRLKPGVSLDFEQAASINVTVTATDKGGHDYAKTFAIGVTDVNEAPTGIQLSNSSVAENAAGATIGKLTTSDPDANESFTYQVSDSRFQVVNGQLQLKPGISFDYETEPSVNLKVTSTDSAGHAIQQSFTVAVTNVNEAPVVVAKGGSVETHVINTSATYNPDASAKVGTYLYSNDNAGEKVPNANLLNGVTAANTTLDTASEVTVTFQKEAAGNRNMVGTYQYDNNGNIIAGSVKFVWLDASAASEGKLGAAMVTDFLGYAQSNTVSLGAMAAGTHVGFFTISNGASDGTNRTLLTDAAAGTANQAAAMAAIASQLSIKVDANGNGHVFVGNSQMNGDVFFTSNKSLNTDFNGANDIDHMASGINASLPNQLVIGVEDLNGGGDRDYNDVVFSVNLGHNAVNKTTQSIVQPVVDFSDIDSQSLSQAVIHTTGFQSGDALNVPGNGLFNVAIQQSGSDYTITISGKGAGVTVDQFESFVNQITFSTTSKAEGARHIDYRIVDEGGLTSNVAHADIGVGNSYEVSASRLAANQNLLGSGDDHLYLNSHLTGKLDFGGGHDTLHFAQNNDTLGHSDFAKLSNLEEIDMTGYGNNKVSLSLTDVLDMTDGNNHLTVLGEKGDTVTLTGDNSGHHWQVVDTSDDFTTYAWSDPIQQAVVEISNQLTANLSS
jgi:VCBS repeat-containing protein